MAYQVALLNFEGPLDLLLQLIERSDLEITEISLSQVTGQYLTYTKQLPALEPTELNQFLELAARLIYLKSLALLPLQQSNEMTEDVADLTQQLQQYRTYQNAGRHLDGLLRQNRFSKTREITQVLPAHKLPMPNITTTLLEQSFANALANLPKTGVHPVHTIGITLIEMTERICSWLRDSNGTTPLGQFLARLTSRTELVVAFIALLELARNKTISVSQDNLFGDIIITTT